MELAKDAGESQALGFHLALTGRLSGDRSFVRWSNRLKDRRYKKSRDYFEGQSERERELARYKTPKTAKAWLYSMNMGFDSFESLFNKFVHDAPIHS